MYQQCHMECGNACTGGVITLYIKIADSRKAVKDTLLHHAHDLVNYYTNPLQDMYKHL